MHSRHLMAMLVTVGAATALSAGGSGAVPLVYQAVEQKLFALPPASSTSATPLSRRPSTPPAA